LLALQFSLFPSTREHLNPFCELINCPTTNIQTPERDHSNVAISGEKTIAIADVELQPSDVKDYTKYARKED
jgi:hypothetical protein